MIWKFIFAMEYDNQMKGVLTWPPHSQINWPTWSESRTRHISEAKCGGWLTMPLV